MTARTVPFWQQVLDQHLEWLAQAENSVQIEFKSTELFGFANGLVGVSAHAELIYKVKEVAAKRRAILKQQGVKA